MEFAAEVKKFNEKPNFSISFDVKNDVVPEAFRDKWEKALNCNDNPNLFISSKKSHKFEDAKQRYIKLTSILKKSDHPWPSLYLFLAEAHFLLSDSGGSLEYLQQLSQLLPDDAKLSQIIQIITQLIHEESIEDEKFHHQIDAEGIRLYTFTTPIECPTIPPTNDSLQTLIEDFTRFKSKEDNAVEQFYRYACVSSNILEGVFSLEGQSWPRLIRCGFNINSIDGISLTSKQKKKPVIVRILNNTLKCLELISSCLNDPAIFTPTFLIQLHSLLLHNDNFHEELIEYASNEWDDEDNDICSEVVIMLIPTGRFRSVPCIIEHNEGEVVTQFCHPREIQIEMERYCELARNLLQDDEIDVFIKVAWLQWAFLRIHPFADGNGRVSRIISSIPLCKLNLPPVAVHQSQKSKYFKAIHQADRESNLEPLANFLKSSILCAIEEIFILPSDYELNKTSPEDGKTKTRKSNRLFQALKN